MTSQLDIHEAGDEEREAAFRNVHDVWSRGRTLEEHLEFRRRSPRHQWATWYVGVVDGRVVTSLGCHPMKFRVHGNLYEGMGIAAVHTLDEFRRRGYARQLIEWVEARQRARKVQLSLLFSDIIAGYYARMGYQLCPSNEGLATWDDASESKTDDIARLVAFDADDNIARMNGFYTAHHGRRPISIERTDAYWQNLLAREPDDQFFWFADENNEPFGYVRLAEKDGKLEITDFALAPRAEGRIETCYRAVILLARSRGLSSVGGWLPDTPAARTCFSVRPRETELTMLKPLDESLELDPAVIAASDYFCETDHV